METSGLRASAMRGGAAGPRPAAKPACASGPVPQRCAARGRGAVQAPRSTQLPSPAGTATAWKPDGQPGGPPRRNDVPGAAPAPGPPTAPASPAGGGGAPATKDFTDATAADLAAFTSGGFAPPPPSPWDAPSGNGKGRAESTNSNGNNRGPAAAEPEEQHADSGASGSSTFNGTQAEFDDAVASALKRVREAAAALESARAAAARVNSVNNSAATAPRPSYSAAAPPPPAPAAPAAFNGTLDAAASYAAPAISDNLPARYADDEPTSFNGTLDAAAAFAPAAVAAPYVEEEEEEEQVQYEEEQAQYAEQEEPVQQRYGQQPYFQEQYEGPGIPSSSDGFEPSAPDYDAPSGPGRGRRAIVVGGGIGGLTVAGRLAREGFDVLILEANAQVCEAGPHRLRPCARACACLDNGASTKLPLPSVQTHPRSAWGCASAPPG